MSRLRETRLKNLTRFLNTVKNLIKNLGTVKLRETDDAAFAGLFSGLTNFLYEGDEYERGDFQKDRVKTRIVNLTNDLWDKGVYRSEF